jgi:hypothetical protein
MALTLQDLRGFQTRTVQSYEDVASRHFWQMPDNKRSLSSSLRLVGPTS